LFAVLAAMVWPQKTFWVNRVMRPLPKTRGWVYTTSRFLATEVRFLGHV
jgi:hypothetical protein